MVRTSLEDWSLFVLPSMHKTSQHSGSKTAMGMSYLFLCEGEEISGGNDRSSDDGNDKNGGGGEMPGVVPDPVVAWLQGLTPFIAQPSQVLPYLFLYPN